MIATGAADAVICGGAEFMSDVPIRFSRKMRGLMMSMPKAKTTKKKLSTISQVIGEFSGCVQIILNCGLVDQ